MARSTLRRTVLKGLATLPLLGAGSLRADDVTVRKVLDVAESGFAGPRKELRPATFRGMPAYANHFPMPGRVAYRILVHVRRPGRPRVLEAQFEYRHHH